MSNKLINTIYREYPKVYSKFRDNYETCLNNTGVLEIRITSNNIVLFGELSDTETCITGFGFVNSGIIEEDLPFPFVFGLFVDFFSQYGIKTFEYSGKCILSVVIFHLRLCFSKGKLK